MWTDEMPTTGKCPSQDCGWQYDVRNQLRNSIEKRIHAADNAVLCPNCGRRISSKWCMCENCGRVVAGSHSFEKKQIVLAVVFLLLLMTFIVKLSNLL